MEHLKRGNEAIKELGGLRWALFNFLAQGDLWLPFTSPDFHVCKKLATTEPNYHFKSRDNQEGQGKVKLVQVIFMGTFCSTLTFKFKKRYNLWCQTDILQIKHYR